MSVCSHWLCSDKQTWWALQVYLYSILQGVAKFCTIFPLHIYVIGTVQYLGCVTAQQLLLELHILSSNLGMLRFRYWLSDHKFPPSTILEYRSKYLPEIWLYLYDSSPFFYLWCFKIRNPSKKTFSSHYLMIGIENICNHRAKVENYSLLCFWFGKR